MSHQLGGHGGSGQNLMMLGQQMGGPMGGASGQGVQLMGQMMGGGAQNSGGMMGGPGGQMGMQSPLSGSAHSGQMMVGMGLVGSQAGSHNSLAQMGQMSPGGSFDALDARRQRGGVGAAAGGRPAADGSAVRCTLPAGHRDRARGDQEEEGHQRADEAAHRQNDLNPLPGVVEVGGGGGGRGTLPPA